MMIGLTKAYYRSSVIFHTGIAILCLAALLSTVFAQDQNTTLMPGVYQAEDSRVKLPDDAKVVNAGGAEFGKAVKAKTVDAVVNGTDVILRWKSASIVVLRYDNNLLIFPETYLALPLSVGGPVRAITFGSSDSHRNFIVISPHSMRVDKNGWVNALIHLGTVSRQTEIQLADTVEHRTSNFPVGLLYGSSWVDSITVVDRTFENVYPYTAAVAIGVGMLLFVVISALRERRRFYPSP